MRLLPSDREQILPDPVTNTDLVREAIQHSSRHSHRRTAKYGQVDRHCILVQSSNKVLKELMYIPSSTRE